MKNYGVVLFHNICFWFRIDESMIIKKLNKFRAVIMFQILLKKFKEQSQH
jgi:hypothetical protein